MITIEVNSAEQRDIRVALFIAAEVYEADANKVSNPVFKKQMRDKAKKVRRLASCIGEG